MRRQSQGADRHWCRDPGWLKFLIPSPLPANIYFPAIPMMAKAFGTLEEVINQTVTAYLVMQGICKNLSFWNLVD